MAKRAALNLDELRPQKGRATTAPAETPEKADDGKKRGQTLRLTPAAWRQLKYLAIDTGRPAHDLLVEAVNDLFRKHGKPPIA
jgi:hypothetical protein